MSRRLLFISPATPAPTGNGRAMRAFQTLKALAARFEVHLLIIESQLDTTPDLTHLSSLCQRIHFLPRSAGANLGWRIRQGVLRRAPAVFSLLFHRPPEWAPISPARLALAAQAFADERFDALHVFRLHLAPYARPWLATGRRPILVELDLDDIESLTRRRIAALYWLNRRPLPTLGCLYQSMLLDRLERQWLAQFDRVWVCSSTDADWLMRHIPSLSLLVAPNVVPLPASGGMIAHPGPFRFLFVATLGYYPNQDGLLWLLRDILPRLRARADRPFVITIAGAGLPAALVRALGAVPEVDWRGYVEDLSVLYRESDAVVVPLRAGGGTRIKIVEAFAWGVPVVATPAGAEGLDVRPGIHLLIASDPDGFAAQCIRLMREASLRDSLVREALSLAAASYGPAALCASLSIPCPSDSPA